MSLVLRVENRPDDEAWAWCESLDVPARQFFRHRPEQAHEQQVYLVEADAIEHIRGYGFVRLSNGAVGWAIDADLRGQGWGRKMVALLQQIARERGLKMLISSTDLTNAASLAAHLKAGFVIDGYTLHWRNA